VGCTIAGRQQQKRRAARGCRLAAREGAASTATITAQIKQAGEGTSGSGGEGCKMKGITVEVEMMERPAEVCRASVASLYCVLAL
jgi:hypothetical protein